MNIQGRGRFVVAAAALAIVAAGATPSAAVIRFTGVNVAGAEFGVSNNTPTDTDNFNLPGTYVQHYLYPNAAEVNYFMGKGINTFRLPFRWERLQRSLNGPLDAIELGRMDTFVDYATQQGATVIIEPHNFQRYYPSSTDFQSSAQGLVGSAVPDSSYADFWSRVAEHYKDKGRVIFNLMNEPNSMPTAQLVTSHNAAIVAIRATGATNIIHVPGNQWTGAHAWNETYYQGANSIHMLNIVDPAKNIVFEVHQYFDDNSSGTSTQIGTNQNPNNVNIGVQRLTNFTNWLKAHDLRGFLGEFALANSRFGTGGTGNNTRIADETLDATLDYLEANSDVWEGWAWWAAGPYWGNYMFTLEPTNLGQPTQADRAAMQYLQPRFATNVPEVAGDFNQDDMVDGDDLILWTMSNGRSGLDLAADGDNDGDVDGNDLLVWQQTLGMTATVAPPAQGVPEPGAAALLAIGLLGVNRRRRGARR
jgi:endoglucanase